MLDFLQPRFRCPPAVLLLAAISLSSNISSASHFRVAGDFDSTFIPGSFSSGNIVSGSPFGGNYFMPSGGAFSVFTIDALPSGTTSEPASEDDSARYLRLSFDIVNLDPISENLLVEFNQNGLVNQGNLKASYITGGTANNFSYEMLFTLTERDFNVTWTKLSPSEWGIDNVVVDWGTPVPIPAAIWLFGSALIGLLRIRKVKSR